MKKIAISSDFPSKTKINRAQNLEKKSRDTLANILPSPCDIWWHYTHPFSRVTNHLNEP
jgi:hypothetical protein